MMGGDSDLKELMAFIMDSDILERVEAQIDEFNVFETLGISKMEIRHSSVLAWLLNPNENHGLDDIFTCNFIKHILYTNKSSLSNDLDLFNIGLMNFKQVNVRREWRNIDILLTCDVNKLVVVIENKVESTEHSNQLQRYYDIVCEEFKDYQRIFVYLTPQGDTPSDEENWIICSYESISNMIQRILDVRKNNMTNNVYNFIQQYNTILRRYIVGNSELEKICQEIYYKHQKALDLIFQYKPDVYMELAEMLKQLIVCKGLILDDSGKSYIRFTTPKLNAAVPNLGEGWTSSQRILLFELVNRDNKLTLKLLIGPGEATIREKLYNISKENISLCTKATRSLGKKWTTIYTKEIIRKKDFEELDIEQLKEIIEEKIENFLVDDLIKIERIFNSIE